VATIRRLGIVGTGRIDRIYADILATRIRLRVRQNAECPRVGRSRNPRRSCRHLTTNRIAQCCGSVLLRHKWRSAPSA